LVTLVGNKKSDGGERERERQRRNKKTDELNVALMDDRFENDEMLLREKQLEFKVSDCELCSR
jgi:hypothetical protein